MLSAGLGMAWNRYVLSSNLSNNLLLLPRILKLIEDMEDDSTPPDKAHRNTKKHWELFTIYRRGDSSSSFKY